LKDVFRWDRGLIWDSDLIFGAYGVKTGVEFLSC